MASASTACADASSLRTLWPARISVVGLVRSPGSLLPLARVCPRTVRMLGNHGEVMEAQVSVSCTTSISAKHDPQGAKGGAAQPGGNRNRAGMGGDRGGGRELRGGLIGRRLAGLACRATSVCADDAVVASAESPGDNSVTELDPEAVLDRRISKSQGSRFDCFIQAAQRALASLYGPRHWHLPP